MTNKSSKEWLHAIHYLAGVLQHRKQEQNGPEVHVKILSKTDILFRSSSNSEDRGTSSKEFSK